MIVDNQIIINITNKNKGYYISKGYSICGYGKYTVNVIDIPTHSHVIITVSCSVCGVIKQIKYCDYNKITTNNTTPYYCKGCKSIKTSITLNSIHGVDNVFCLDSVKNKIKETNLNRLGVEYPMQSEVVKSKAKKTNLDKFGVEYPTQCITVIEKQKNTNYSLYGCYFTLHNTRVINKSNITKLERYGTINISKNNTIQNKKQDTRLVTINFKYANYDIVGNTDNTYDIMCDCGCEHVFNITPDLFRNRIKYKTIVCTICNPINSFSVSGLEIELRTFIESLYNNEIIYNNRKIIKPYEVDIYLPDLNLAIEFNGIYWHSDINKPNDYHQNKTNLLRDIGIKLIHIWEDDWINKKNIVKSMLKAEFNTIDKKINSNVCDVRIVGSDIAENFILNNTIDSHIKSNMYFGLFYVDELVYVLALDGCLITHLCCKLDYCVDNGASKLFEYYIQIFNPKIVYSYVDKSFNDCKLYTNLNFVLVEETPPNYYYVVNNTKQKIFQIDAYRLFDSGDLIFKYEP